MNTLLSTMLHSTKDGADKIYIPAIIVNPTGGYDVIAQNGRRGGTLALQKPKVSGVDESAARAAYARLVAAKVKDGYRPLDGDAIAAVAVSERDGKSAGLPVMLLNPITEAELHELLGDPSWCWQEKIDGERRGVIVAADGVAGYNRRSEYVPLPVTIADAVGRLASGTTLDGEIVGDVLYVFDALRIGGVAVAGRGFRDRYEDLARTLHENESPHLVLVPLLSAAEVNAQRGNGAEGVVGKKAAAPYVDGRGHAVAVKHKHYNTATVEVVGHNVAHSVAVAVYDASGAQVNVGNVTIAPTMALPVIGSIVEVRYLYAYRGGSLYQPSFQMMRRDVGVDACAITQLVYKGAGTGGDEVCEPNARPSCFATAETGGVVVEKYRTSP